MTASDVRFVYVNLCKDANILCNWGVQKYSKFWIVRVALATERGAIMGIQFPWQTCPVVIIIYKSEKEPYACETKGTV